MMRRGPVADGAGDDPAEDPTDMLEADTLICARWIVPVEPADTVLEEHALVVHGGRIVAILPQREARARYTARETHVLDAHVLVPGLVNTHTHAAMTLFRGIADDLPLMQWLEHHVWPAEQRWISEAFVRDGTRLAIAEMLRGGTTCFNDMYFYPDEVARVAADAGIRATVGLIVLDFPTGWARDADEYLAKAIDVHDQLEGDPLVHTAFAPHAPYTVSDGPLERVRTYADELDVPVHMHVHETAAEIAQSLDAHGVRPLARLDRLGLLSHRLVAVHMTQLEAAEIERFAECGAHVAHCAESNLKLASGMCPVERLRAAGVSVALGTDGAASNNDLSMLGELHTASLLAKAVAGDARALPAHAALEAATLAGARALGREDEIGSLVVGKEADVVAVDLDDLDTLPVYHPVSQVVYSAGRRQISHVWIAGREIVRDGALLTLDADAIAESARAWGRRIAER